MKLQSGIQILALCMALAGCVSPPTGPAVTVLPGSSKDLSQFNRDEMLCRNYAQNGIGGGTQAAANSAGGTAVAGTVVGAAAGALIGAASGHAGPGALIGAGSGLLVGSSMASDSGYRSSADLQDRYDAAYTQCMYAQGNKVPVAYGTSESEPAASEVPPDYYPTPAADGDVPPDYVPR